jgi:uncharacterized SAM-binding protein YcdF (DUF218 family)
MPLTGCMILALIGLVLLWFTRRQRTGKALLTVSFLVLGLLSFEPVSGLLARPLEQQYAPLTDVRPLGGIKWVVVLGGGSTVDRALPASTHLTEASLRRLTEGVSLHRRLPGSRLLLTGGSGYRGMTPVADAMAVVATRWGVDPRNIVLETESADTKDHPVFVKRLVRGERFVMVTSASHMPRAMALFRGQGMEPVPAPTDYMAVAREGLTPRDFFPSARSLDQADRALREYLGMVWARLRGQAEGRDVVSLLTKKGSW